MSKIQYKDPAKYIITAYNQELNRTEIMGYVNTEEEAVAFCDQINYGKYDSDITYYRELYKSWSWEETHKILIK